MRVPATLPRYAMSAGAAFTLAACGMADEEPPANQTVVEDPAVQTVNEDEAVPAPDAMEPVVDVPDEDLPGVTPNTVDGVGTDDATDEGLEY